MLRARLDQLLTGAAVAVVLAVSGSANNAFAQTAAQIEAAMPSADTSELPPPTIKDISPQPPAATPAPAPQAAAPVAPAPVAPAPNATGMVAPAATADADAAISDKLREIAAGKYDRLLGGKKDRADIEKFYSGRNFATLWISNGALNDRAKAVAGYLTKVDADGLDPEDYPIPEVKAGAEPGALAEAELRLTQTVLTFARHAENGRVHYSRVAADIEYALDRADPSDVLAKIAGAPNVAATLDGFQPQQPAYKALKTKLAEARRGPGNLEKPRLPGGLTLKYSKDKKGKETIMNDPRVPQLREMLGMEGGDVADTAYDKTVADAVAKFQKQKGLPANGQLTQQTVQALNGPSRERDADIIMVNMERWRWMPRDLGKTYVMVNIPDFTLRVVRDGKLYWNTKIVVGKPTQATPIMSAEMKFITVNPTWNVPPSIIKNEYLPAMQSDPTVLERMGLKIAQNPDGTVRIWQPPGDRNALGRIRFNFPNKFLVYQHDTPDKNLFAHDRRAYSHGCMRVMDPLKYGEVLLSLVLPQENYTAERLRKMFGGSEVNINFPQHLPVHLTYQTAYVDDAGKLVVREDIYGRDARMIPLLKGSERKMADVPMDRPRNTSSVPVRAPAGSYGSYGGAGGSAARAPSSFFDALFGSWQQPAAAAPRPAARTRAASRGATVR
jgi:murein L,D-transpeptidase YcbB/YkuD